MSTKIKLWTLSLCVGAAAFQFGFGCGGGDGNGGGWRNFARFVGDLFGTTFVLTTVD